MVFYAGFKQFQSYHGDNSHYSCPILVSTVLGSEVSFQNTEDPVRLELKAPALRLSHPGPFQNSSSIEKK